MLTYVLLKNKTIVIDMGDGFVIDYGTLETFEKDPKYTKEDKEFLKEHKWLEK